MPTRLAVTLYEGNTQVIVATITPDDPADDLTTATGVVAVIKDDPCTADTAVGVVTLSSTDSAQVNITAQTVTEIVAEITIPPSVTIPPYERWWRVDVLFGPTARRTATYGPVTVVDV